MDGIDFDKSSFHKGMGRHQDCRIAKARKKGKNRNENGNPNPVPKTHGDFELLHKLYSQYFTGGSTLPKTAAENCLEMSFAVMQ